MSQIIINGNNIDILKTYPDNYFDAVVTDPPYGLGKEPNAAELMKDWVQFGYHEVKGTGFMGKEWDAFVPQPIFWKELFRVLKHGGHVLSFFGTRTYDWGVMSMRFAGFEVRDCIQWLYGSGFPKSHNIGKAIDKIQGNEREVVGKVREGRKTKQSYSGNLGTDADITNGNTEWEGWGTALKPSNEPIVLARKPLEKGLSVAENILKWGVGGINIDASRIGVSEDDPNYRHNPSQGNKGENSIFGAGGHNGSLNAQGRFPANIILTHHPECVCKGTKKVKAILGGTKPVKGNYKLTENKTNQPYFNFSDENGEETIENWDCHEDCPIKILDQQSGLLKSGDIKPHKEKGTNNSKDFFSTRVIRETNYKGDTGGASRFFYVAKASKSERNKGLDGFEVKEKPDNYILPKLTCSECGSKSVDSSNSLVCGCNGKTHYEKQNSLESKNNLAGGNKNFHPTVKPIKLMQYLVKMITPPNGKVLDPFCGSGTTGVACKIEGYQFVGMEQDAEYFKIAQARINNYIKNTKEYKEDTIQAETSIIKIKKQLTLF